MRINTYLENTNMYISRKNMTSNNEKLNHIHWNVETKVKEGYYEKLNLIIDKMEEYVKNNEPDTLGYSFYFNSDKDKLFIHEYYTNY